LVAPLARGKLFAHSCRFLPILSFFASFAAIKKIFQKIILQKCKCALVLDATFVPNLALLGLLSPEVSFGEQAVTHTTRHPAYIAISEALKNIVKVCTKYCYFFLGHGVYFNKKRNEANFESTNFFQYVCNADYCHR